MAQHTKLQDMTLKHENSLPGALTGSAHNNDTHTLTHKLTSVRKCFLLGPSSVAPAASRSAASSAVPNRQAAVGLSKLSASSRGVKSERRCSLVSARSICTKTRHNSGGDEYQDVNDG